MSEDSSRQFHVKLIDGVAYDPWKAEGPAPSPETIAWGLANLNRYCGHTIRPLSVAEHSIWVAMSIAYYGSDNPQFKQSADSLGQGDLYGAFFNVDPLIKHTALIGLCHDCPEAAGLVDLPSPVGRHVEMQPYKDAHDRCATWLCQSWGVSPPPWPDIIKQTDHSVLGAEAAIRPGNGTLGNGETVCPWPNLDLLGAHNLARFGVKYVREAWLFTFHALKDEPYIVGTEESQLRLSVATNALALGDKE